jgi:hypothetical protein
MADRSKRLPAGGVGMRKGPKILSAAGVLREQLSLMDLPPLCPKLPTRNSLAYRALKLFVDGEVLDHRDFFQGSGSWRLAAVVFRLRVLGWPVETIEVPSPTEEHLGRTIALYKLPAKYTDQGW